MNRREWIRSAISLPLLGAANSLQPALAAITPKTPSGSRVRPGDPGWPSPRDWERLKAAVGGRLLKPQSPLAICRSAPESETCRDVMRQLTNPFYVGDNVALTQTSGWVDAWTSQPSAYAVAAESAADVVAAVNFAREHHIRLVVKGGGHSYQGTSQAPDSLLVWTRHMKAIELHDAFVAQGCAASQQPQPAVSVAAGAMWIDAYDAVTTQGGRYVQGGGCTTVGVAGLIQSGGFGSFSKNYGTASAGLLEVEIVTADGAVKVANACQHADLFWAIKGGGGGSFGVVTRLTLRTRELPEDFGAVFGVIRASSDEAYRALIARAVSFYQGALFNRHWGEQMRVGPGNTLELSMVFQGLDQAQAGRIWAPFVEWVRSDKSYSFVGDMRIVSLPARHFWDADFLKQHAAGLIASDDRPGAAAKHFVWAGDRAQVGFFLHGYRSLWLPDTLLHQDRQSDLVDALFAASRQWGVALHFNKGLAGAPAEEIAAAKDTAMNPKALQAFALAILGGEGKPAYAGLPGPNLPQARDESASIDRAADELARIAPDGGAYVSESNYFQRDWQSAFWGSNYARLTTVKQAYDPAGLFFIRHGVGSEAWSEDGFRRQTIDREMR
jgi:FAD/FMN-containing dehydrogenase